MASRLLERGDRVTRTSSLGRLFDAVAFLLGVCDVNRFEGQAAAALESAALESAPVEHLPSDLTALCSNGRESLTIDICPLILVLLAGIEDGRPVSQLARVFHGAVAEMLAKAAHWAAKRAHLNRIVLSGGCFANRILTGDLADRLIGLGHEVFVHRQVPTTDGGLALGQAVVAAARLRRRRQCV